MFEQDNSLVGKIVRCTWFPLYVQ